MPLEAYSCRLFAPPCVPFCDRMLSSGARMSHNSDDLHRVQVARASDLGRNDRIAIAKTHLGGILHPGASQLGSLPAAVLPRSIAVPHLRSPSPLLTGAATAHRIVLHIR
jgi:hypothetical protein